jgi:hypothetical protein
MVVPAYSGNLTQISGLASYANIIAHQEGAGYDPNDPSTWPPTHVGFTFVPQTVRQIISYITDIDLSDEKEFWNVEYDPPSSFDLRWTGYSCSPVRLLVTDPLGRRAGLDLNTGQVINEIPGAFVTEDGVDPQFIMVPDIEGEYLVEGRGVSEGTYKIGAIYGITNPVIVKSLVGTTTVGATYNFTFTSNPPPIYLPIIFKQASGMMMQTAPEFYEEMFNSPLPTPTPTPQPIVTIESLMTILNTAYEQGQIDKESVYQDLSKTLNKAQKYLSEGKMDKAVKELETFIKEVEKRRDKHIIPEIADQMIAMAQQLIIQLKD